MSEENIASKRAKLNYQQTIKNLYQKKEHEIFGSSNNENKITEKNIKAYFNQPLNKEILKNISDPKNKEGLKKGEVVFRQVRDIMSVMRNQVENLQKTFNPTTLINSLKLQIHTLLFEDKHYYSLLEAHHLSNLLLNYQGVLDTRKIIFMYYNDHPKDALIDKLLDNLVGYEKGFYRNYEKVDGFCLKTLSEIYKQYPQLKKV